MIVHSQLEIIKCLFCWYSMFR